MSDKLRDVLGKDGFIIDQLTINGALRLPENVATARRIRRASRTGPARAVSLRASAEARDPRKPAKWPLISARNAADTESA